MLTESAYVNCSCILLATAHELHYTLDCCVFTLHLYEQNVPQLLVVNVQLPSAPPELLNPT
jgi:hypothetical protein